MEQDAFRELVRLAIDGDEAAFVQIYEMKLGVIYYHANKMLHNETDAEDATSDIVLLMHKNITQLKHPEAFNVWLMRIISNVCIGTSMKKKRIDNNISIEDSTVEYSDEDIEFIPHKKVEEDELKRTIQKIIGNLPKKRRLAIIMYYYDGMSYKEIAVALGISTSTVGTNIVRAKEMIKKELEKEMGKYGVKSGSGAGSDVATFAAVPLITQALKSEQLLICTPAKLEGLRSSVSVALNSGVHNSIAATKVTSAKFVAKFAAGVAAISVAGVIAILAINPAYVPPEPPVSVQTPVPAPDPAPIDQPAEVYEGSENSYLNPTKITLANLPKDLVAVWQITNVDDDEVLYSGKGASVAAPLSALVSEKKDGIYLVSFKYTKSDGEEVIKSTEFQIKTD